MIFVLIVIFLFYALKELAIKLIGFLIGIAVIVGIIILLITWGPPLIAALFSIITSIIRGVFNLVVKFPIPFIIVVVILSLATRSRLSGNLRIM